MFEVPPGQMIPVWRKGPPMGSNVHPENKMCNALITWLCRSQYFIILPRVQNAWKPLEPSSSNTPTYIYLYACSQFCRTMIILMFVTCQDYRPSCTLVSNIAYSVFLGAPLLTSIYFACTCKNRIQRGRDIDSKGKFWISDSHYEFNIHSRTNVYGTG